MAPTSKAASASTLHTDVVQTTKRLPLDQITRAATAKVLSSDVAQINLLRPKEATLKGVLVTRSNLAAVPTALQLHKDPSSKAVTAYRHRSNAVQMKRHRPRAGTSKDAHAWRASMAAVPMVSPLPKEANLKVVKMSRNHPRRRVDCPRRPVPAATSASNTSSTHPTAHAPSSGTEAVKVMEIALKVNLSARKLARNTPARRPVICPRVLVLAPATLLSGTLMPSAAVASSSNTVAASVPTTVSILKKNVNRSVQLVKLHVSRRDITEQQIG